MLKTIGIKTLGGTLALAAGIAALGAAGAARASVTVLGNSFAAECSKAAKAGASRLEFEDVCTLSIENEPLTPHDRAATYVNRGVMRLRRHEYPAAQGDFDAAIQMQPNMGEAYVNRGAAAIANLRFKEGLSDTNRALELGVNEPEKAYFNRAVAYEGLDNMKAAYFDYLKALQLRPDWEAPKKELTRFSVEQPAHLTFVQR